MPEFFLGAGMGVLICAMLAYTFYRSFPVFWGMLPLGVLLGAAFWRQQLMEKRRRQLAEQFKEAAMILASLLSAGYSVENAFAASIPELTTLYGKDGLITREFSFIVQKVRMNRPLETVLSDFAERTGMEEIRSFSEVFSVAKRSSGDLGGIMRHTAEVLRDKMQVQEEILTMTASQRFEQRIMDLIPFFIVFYVDGSSPGFFDAMYGTAAGRTVMTVCLFVYAASILLGRKILAIEM